MRFISPSTHFSFHRRKIIISVASMVLLSTIIAFTVFVTNRPLVHPQAISIVPAGVKLPSDQECAAHVHQSSWEPRADNTTANHIVPTQQQMAQLAPWNVAIGVDPKADALRKRVSGNFTGTTDEILQWIACKWGIDADIVRAEAVVESSWHQNQRGDYTTDKSACPPGSWDGRGCYQSYGILQIKSLYYAGTWPMSRDDTAFSADYTYGVIRTCLDGWTTYLHTHTPLPGYPTYHTNDIWGCLGRWYSGDWYSQSAVNYIQKVKTALDEKAWLQSGF